MWCPTYCELTYLPTYLWLDASSWRYSAGPHSPSTHCASMLASTAGVRAWLRVEQAVIRLDNRLLVSSLKLDTGLSLDAGVILDGRAGFGLHGRAGLSLDRQRLRSGKCEALQWVTLCTSVWLITALPSTWMQLQHACISCRFVPAPSSLSCCRRLPACSPASASCHRSDGCALIRGKQGGEEQQQRQSQKLLLCGQCGRCTRPALFEQHRLHDE